MSIRRRIRRSINAVIGPERAGQLDHLLKSDETPPLNGQAARTALMDHLIDATGPTHAVETGTHLGSTTRWLGERIAPAPVFSVEANPRSYGRARRALRSLDNVTVTLDDSRDFLRELVDGHRLPAGRGLFYLDAHWYDDLPLPDEIAIVLAGADDPLIVIDDMEVPGDPGYGFDDYGVDKRLDAALVETAVAGTGAQVWYPATPSSEETGRRRGCCVIALRPATVSLVDGIAALRR